LVICPTFIPLNAELVACRTLTPPKSRQEERDQPTSQCSGWAGAW
jgi:hypothetical protein